MLTGIFREMMDDVNDHVAETLKNVRTVARNALIDATARDTGALQSSATGKISGNDLEVGYDQTKLRAKNQFGRYDYSSDWLYGHTKPVYYYKGGVVLDHPDRRRKFVRVYPRFKGVSVSNIRSHIRDAVEDYLTGEQGDVKRRNIHIRVVSK